MLQQFKNFDTDRLDVDELVALVAFGTMFRNEYEKHALDVPDWVDNNLRALKRDLKTKNAERLSARRKELKARLEALKTPSQRKAETEKELKSIEAQLQEV